MFRQSTLLEKVVNVKWVLISRNFYKKAHFWLHKYSSKAVILPISLKPLDTEGIEYVIFSDVEPNPTCKNVTDGG